MLQLRDGRTLYYGKGDVLTYRTYAAPLGVKPIPESAYIGESNVIFAHNVKFSVCSEQLLTSFSKGDNSLIVATDSMKNFILRQAARYSGSTTEGFLAFVGDAFLNQYPHISTVDIQADKIHFDTVRAGGRESSGLVFKPSHNEHAHASLVMNRSDQGGEIVSHISGLADLQLIKVSGSSFYGFIRDEYTTLPESYDRPLFIYLHMNWHYTDTADALDSSRGRYVPAEQVRDLAQHIFHSIASPSIQYLVCQIGLHLLKRFPQLAGVHFESNNRTWEAIADHDPHARACVYTEPRPPYGFQGFSLNRSDLTSGEFEMADCGSASRASVKPLASP
ncbi:factor-independent urate hydroxylase [Paenibacillus sp. OV219]|uniref:factor-independent urate hydroxylase n=1 Tax=Paenibacillus sp. OV219 TaxID=1884377 RepID=UPI0008D881F6|nr:urate oxidase [Paenibacillus sp. OV219]SEM86710.1 urate oxidase [Paenibacillus sp. OV219]